MTTIDTPIRLLFESFMNNSPALNFIKDSSGRYVYANKAFSLTGGLQPEEMIGRQDFDIYANDVATAFRHNDELVRIADRALAFTESTLINGRRLYWHVIKFPIHTPDGQVLLAGNAVDVSARVLAEDVAKKSEERFRLVARATDDLVYDCDLCSNTIWWNENLAIRFGYWRTERAYDMEWWQSCAVHDDDRERVMDSLNSAIARRAASWSAEYRFLRADGKYASVLDRGHVVYDNEHRPVRIIGAVIDLTERVRSEELLREANDMLEARVHERTAELALAMHSIETAHEAQRRFVADASHDLRTPLTVIRAEIDLLLSSPSTADAAATRASLGRAAEQARRLEKLATDLLALATLDSAERGERVDNVRLDELLLESISGLASIAGQRGISWNVAIDDAVEIMCDLTSLQRAIVNVLDNAIKYSSLGDAIDIRFVRETDRATIIVRDNGIGIAPMDLPRIYDRFYRSDAARSTQGTGLGLPIAKAVFDAHDGSISVESEQGGGTTVTMVLPISSNA